jgi:hypothetical protein
MIIRITYIATLFLLLGFIAKAQPEQPLLEKEISLPIDSIQKSALLDTLSQLLNIHFSYNPEFLEANKKVKIEMQKTPLSTILRQLINKEEADFKDLGNQIIFFPLHEKKDVQKTLSYKIVKGLVVTGRKETPIPYCNITITGKMMGTMANMDGLFTIKIPDTYWADSLSFSCMGFSTFTVPIEGADSTNLLIYLQPKTFQLKPIVVFNYDAKRILDSISANIPKNYLNKSVLYTTFYREMIAENEAFIDISEAVLQVKKAPYNIDFKEDQVWFLKGRKGAEKKPFNNITFKLKGGPYYITKLDVVKNNESFINPESRHLYTYEYERKLLLDGRESIVISFTPLYSLRDVLYEGEIFVDLKTWAIARVEFNYTSQGLKEARQLLIHREPRNCKAIPSELAYTVQYKYFDGIWYLLSAQSSMRITIKDKEQRQKTKFHSLIEILTTNIDLNETDQFHASERFKPNEIFTEKIVGYDRAFWENYNTIQPEEKLIDALKGFDNQNLTITHFQP